MMLKALLTEDSSRALTVGPALIPIEPKPDASNKVTVIYNENKLKSYYLYI